MSVGFCCVCHKELSELPVSYPCYANCTGDASCIFQQEDVCCPWGHMCESDSSLQLNQKLFHNTDHFRECKVCLEFKPGSQFIPVTNCNDVYCIQCAFTWILQSIQSVDNHLIRCINPKCKKTTSLTQLLLYINLSNWEELPLFTNERITPQIVEIYLEKIALEVIPPEVRCYCPLCFELIVLSLSVEECYAEPSQTKIVCPYCSSKFCLRCSSAWHKGQTCLEHQTMTDDLSQVQLAAQNSSKRCPKCKVLTVHYKYHGCHHIKPKGGCPTCGLAYCYACLTPKWPCKKLGCRIVCSKLCDCPLCPECTLGFKCDQCDGCPNCSPELFVPRAARSRISKINSVSK